MVIVLGSSNGGAVLWSRGRPGKLVRIAQQQPGHGNNLLRMAPEVRNALEDRRHAGHVEALDAPGFRKPPFRSPAASPTSTPRLRSAAVVSLIAHEPGPPGERRRRGSATGQPRKLTAGSPPSGASTMTLRAVLGVVESIAVHAEWGRSLMVDGKVSLITLTVKT